MLRSTELHHLNRWCRRHALRWYPAHRHGSAMLVLEGLRPRHAWARMIVAQTADGLRLQDERQEILATASTLPALLDAMEAGVGEAGVGEARRPT